MTASLLETLLHGNQLKRTARTGWVQRGVPDPENVAAHSYGVAFTVLALAAALEEKVDLGRALAMALLHDLPEALTSDIPTPSWRFLPAGSKEKMERRVLEAIVAGTNFEEEWSALWEEFQAAETAAARLVHDADKLELYIQALIYEEQSGNRRLAEFWSKPAAFHFPQSKATYEELRARREKETP